MASMQMSLDGGARRPSPLKPKTPQVNKWVSKLSKPTAKSQSSQVIYTGPSRSQSSSPSTSTPSPAPSGGGGGGGGGGYDAYAAAAAKAAKEKADREAKENANTKAQVEALKAALTKTFAQARDTKLGNISTASAAGDASLLANFERRLDPLKGSLTDNEKSEHDASFANLANRARERGDILAEALSLGAGESDTLRAQQMAFRNYSSNQADVNRSYFDTLRSINNAITDLNVDTRSARFNLATDADAERAKVWNDFYNQEADTWTQIGNIEAQNTNESYVSPLSAAEKGKAFSRAATSAGKAYKSTGVSKDITDWEGAKVSEGSLNNTRYDDNRGATGSRKPEGATLRRW